MVGIEELVEGIEDGAKLVMAPDYAGAPLAAVRALIRRKVQGLHLIGAPQFGLAADLLVGAGCAHTVETAGLGLGEFGLAPRFRDAVAKGAVHLKDATCPAIHAGLQAAEKGVPFMPIRGIIGSDLTRQRNDWTVIDSPLGDAEPILLVAAIEPDVALAHAPMADRDGNVWVGLRREIMTMAHSSKKTLVTVERLFDGCQRQPDDRPGPGAGNPAQPLRGRGDGAGAEVLALGVSRRIRDRRRTHGALRCRSADGRGLRRLS